MQIPINEKSTINLMHGFLTFQIYLNSTKSFTIEIAISDNNNGKKRILLSACSKEFIINQMHCRIPIINIPIGIWINLSINILSFVSECFKGQTFRAIDSICLSADCKVRRICGMRQLYSLSEEEYFQGDESILPKGFAISNDIKYINFNLDMNYIRENLELKNIKNNIHMNKEKKIYPKTSQSKRDSKLRYNFNNYHQNPDKENQKLNNENKLMRTDKRNNSINKTKIKSNIDNKSKINKKFHHLKENSILNRGSSKNIRNLNDLNSLKNELKGDNKVVSTTKKENKSRSIYKINPKKEKEKLNSKSVKKIYTKNNPKINLQEKKSNLEEKLDKQTKNKEIINKGKNSIQNNINIKNNNNLNEKENIVNNMTPIIQINQVLINNNTNNNIITKEDLNLFNTFNYKELESRENTLIINQSNFNNASIPEIFDIDINNKYTKNNENDINFNNNEEMILIDKNNRNEKNFIKNQVQIDSTFGEKILSEINGNSYERPYTPPIQKMVPLKYDNNNAYNNVNISKINESLIQNHYGDLVYDNETGSLYDKKTKIHYELK